MNALVDGATRCIIKGMPREHEGIFHKAGEYIGHWAVTGSFIALTGVAPEHWFSELLEKSRLSEFISHAWPAGWDLRLIPVSIGVLIIVWDVLSHRRHLQRAEVESPVQSAPPPVIEIKLTDDRTTASESRGRPNGAEKAKPIAPVLPRSIGTLFKGREELLRQLHARLTRKTSGQSAIAALHGLGGIGKTRIAVEYAWEYWDRYSAALWALADTPEISAARSGRPGRAAGALQTSGKGRGRAAARGLGVAA